MWKDKLLCLFWKLENRGIIWYDVENATGLWQPVGAGTGRIIKVLVFHDEQDWLEYDGNRSVDGTLSGETQCKAAYNFNHAMGR